jgi:hypothetical protein
VARVKSVAVEAVVGVGIGMAVVTVAGGDEKEATDGLISSNMERSRHDSPLGYRSSSKLLTGRCTGSLSHEYNNNDAYN